MAFHIIQDLPKAEEMLQELPLPESLKKVKKERDEAVSRIIRGESSAFLVIVGPCSAHDPDAVCEYVSRLARVQEKVRDILLLIPRIYTNKPRTLGTGYKGMLHQPNPTAKPNIVEGIKALRAMHIRALEESHLSAADEMLYPGNYPYVEDLLSYVAIGARSVANQQHRLTVSGLDIPVGMKNPTSGEVRVMLESIYAAQHSHVFVYNNKEVRTDGNPLAHGVLRGAVDPSGIRVPNYHYEDLLRISHLYLKQELKNPALIVDVNHDNSNKRYEEQPRIAREVMQSRYHNPELKKIIKGLMIESYLVGGRQESSGAVFGQSITDPCLDWNDTERLLLDIAEEAAR
ncbi:MAG: phospho-2-dehydro-3-deoxyheptonate aldolase [Marinimicrobia bacterium 46_43]|nr:MAG: phospho-2-dehydro-3-deoxyheptonate aldolase [Marinimicrobia bacterium 46_43]HBY18937.1 3-deoxy-7-phosphoheptulonate synthase [Candidatus Neomarinimicrobiota bacterium]